MIEKEAIEHISEALKSNSTLETFSLGYLFSFFFFVPLSHDIVVLDCDVADDTTKYIFEAMKTNKGLKKLHLRSHFLFMPLIQLKKKSYYQNM